MEIIQLQLLQVETKNSKTISSENLVVVFNADSCKFYYNDGTMYEANIPFLLQKAWILPSGLLLWRKPELNEDETSQIPFLFSWNHPLEEIKWVPLSWPQKEFMKFNDTILNVQDVGRIFIFTRDEWNLYLWEYKVLQVTGKNLDRNYSIHRSSPVNCLKESISNALGDTRSKHGMELLMSINASGCIKKVFVTCFKGNTILWVVSDQELKGYNVFSKELLISESCLDAALVKATSQDNFDVLILKKQGTLFLWNNSYGLNSVVLPKDFYFSLPRKRSIEESCLEKKARIIELQEPMDEIRDSVNLTFSDGTVYNAKFNFKWKSTIVKRLMDAIQGQIEISKEAAIVKRFQNFHFSSEYNNLREDDEFGNFVIILYSFLDIKFRNDSGNGHKKISDIQRKIPKSVLSALKISQNVLFQSRFGNLVSKSQSLKREIQSNLVLEVDDLKALLLSFHLVYESLKLNVVLKKYLAELGEFLLEIASSIGALWFVEYYRSDGIPQGMILMSHLV